MSTERCDGQGPVFRSAKLRAPLKGTVLFSGSKPYRVRTIVIDGRAATARGIRVGSTTAELIAAAVPAHAPADGSARRRRALPSMSGRVSRRR